MPVGATGLLPKEPSSARTIDKTQLKIAFRRLLASPGGGQIFHMRKINYSKINLKPHTFCTGRRLSRRGQTGNLMNIRGEIIVASVEGFF
jgi:hypothetical protein